mgnify:CR=1 FL=1
MSFASLGLSPFIEKELIRQNFTKPSPIQEVAIPAIINGKDVLGIAQTGSGKTISYVLPTLMNLLGNCSTKNRHIDALILVPTRELAVQVGDVFQQFSAVLPEKIKTMSVFGGVSINPQMIALQNVNVLIATPGRLLDLLNSKALKLSDLKVLVLDEADKMLNLGFKKELDQILELVPAKRQNLLFSATLSKNISNIRKLILSDPTVIKVEPEKENLDLIKQTAYAVSEERKGPLLRFLIKQNDLKQVLVFTSSVYKADNVADKLRKNGIQAKAIHRRKSQLARTESLQDFKEGNLRVLVATDILARGIDIEFLPCVVNYELPRSPKDYVHRIGRTGRAENPGDAISLITPEEAHHFGIIQKKMKRIVELIETKDFDLHKK